jgi:hypothetical protein
VRSALAVLTALLAGVALGAWTTWALAPAPDLADLEQRLAEVRAEALRAADACRATTFRVPTD